jgi:hypothetical protein
MCVPIYVYIRVPIYVYQYTCTNIRVPIYVYQYTCTNIRVPIYVYVLVYTCTNIRVPIYVYQYMRVYTCPMTHYTYVRVLTRIFVNVCTNIRVYTCPFTRICVSLHVYMPWSLGQGNPDHREQVFFQKKIRLPYTYICPDHWARETQTIESRFFKKKITLSSLGKGNADNAVVRCVCVWCCWCVANVLLTCCSCVVNAHKALVCTHRMLLMCC